MINKILEQIDKELNKNTKELIKKEINSKSFTQKLNDLIKKEINNLKNELNNPMFEDVFKNKCILSEITKDHILPKSKKGSDAKQNIIMLCNKSNKSKGDKLEGIINDIKFKVHNIQETKAGSKATLEVSGKSINVSQEFKRYKEFKSSIEIEK